jgi:hypothetical protein
MAALGSSSDLFIINPVFPVRSLGNLFFLDCIKLEEHWVKDLFLLFRVFKGNFYLNSLKL